ncbi:MAG: hypothetical protein Q4B91_03530 [Atopobiaceae bacterium]|nr:hypothetical protein [Atopobiaceae bacterium]
MEEKPKGTTVEVDGIEVTVALDPANDYELVECAVIANDPARTVEEQNRAYVRRVRLILGDAHDRVMRELREAHGGELEPATVADFVARVTARVAEAKN